MSGHEPAWMTIVEAAAAIRSCALAPSDLTEACLKRIGECETHVGAWITVGAEQARMEARLRDTQAATTPMHGIPFGVKDIIETADLPTGYGTPIYNTAGPTRDAACVALLKEAGGIGLGKTVTTELAHFHPGKTCNPHDLTRTPGGSSSGSAAAVAAGTVQAALGTQTTGSVLRPAAFCGVFGFKPSYGDVSRSGVMDCAASFDTVGWFTRGLDDVEIVRQALLRLPPRPLADVSVADLRIGVFEAPDKDEADDETAAIIERAAGDLARAGATVTTVTAPDGFEAIARHHRTIAGFEFARAITWERTQYGQLLSPKLLDGRCGDGLQASYEDYVAAQEALAELRVRFADLMQSYDLLLSPTAPGPAPEGILATGDPVFNTAWTALYGPAITIPAFKSRAGLPIGLQLAGRFRRDADLLAAAKAVGRVFDMTQVRDVVPT